MIIGIIYVAYQAEDLLPRSLSTWIAARRDKLGGHEFVICAVSVPFEGFGQEATDKTRTLLGFASTRGDIDHVIVRDKPMKEIEARGKALQWLVERGCQLTWMVDADEFYLKEDIQGAVAYVENQPYVDWFRVPLKNLVFTRNQYLAEPFTPPRIHRVHIRGYRAHSFWADNNVLYGGTITRDLKQDLHFASATVPVHLCNPLHESWLNNARSKAKIDYQVRARGWGSCSFAWDEARGGLVFNEAHYAVQGLPLPTVLRLGE